MTTGSRIKQMRIARGYSQRELSKLVGYTDHSIITRIESGQTDLPISKLKKIAEVLDVPIPWLMCLDDAEPPERDEMGVLWETATEQQKQQAIQYLKFLMKD